MPIPIEDYREPKFVKIDTRYPLSVDKLDRFYKFETNPRSYRGTGGSFKMPGYNPNHQSTRVERKNINSDTLSFKPY